MSANEVVAMKVVILAGGLGTRLSEETEVRPKPLVEIGGYPIIWHIMKHYVAHGYRDFVVPLGYKGEEIKRYFLDYSRLRSSVTVNLATGQSSFHEEAPEDWNVSLIDTGLKTNTGARVKRLQPWLEGETFMLTYGDGVCNIDLKDLERFHRKHGRLATVTAIRPPARSCGLIFYGDSVSEYPENPLTGEGWINGGFTGPPPRLLQHPSGHTPRLQPGRLDNIPVDRPPAAHNHAN